MSAAALPAVVTVKPMIDVGINVDKDKADFMRSVVEPMDALWAEFTDEEKEYWDKVKDAVRIFNGRIV